MTIDDVAASDWLCRLDDPLGGVVAGVVGGEIVEMLAVDEDHLDDS